METQSVYQSHHGAHRPSFLFTSWCQESWCIFCTIAQLFQTRKEDWSSLWGSRKLLPIKSREMCLMLVWSLKTRMAYLFFPRKLGHHIPSLISELCDILLHPVIFQNAQGVLGIAQNGDIFILFPKHDYIRNRIFGLHRPVNSSLLNMLVFISMPIFSTRWKSFLVFHSNIFTGSKHFSFLALIC